MRLRIKALLVAAASVVTTAGCQEPRVVAPVAPPGLEDNRIPVLKPGEGAQALGETGNVKTAVKQHKVVSDAANSPPTPIGKPVTTASGLVYETLKEGTGASAKSGDTVTMHYTGKLTNGKQFDSSVGKAPFVTEIGSKQVIGGWDEGVPGMKVGERRKLTIPPELGYGPGGSPPDIPGNATLVFEVELLGVK